MPYFSALHPVVEGRFGQLGLQQRLGNGRVLLWLEACSVTGRVGVLAPACPLPRANELTPAGFCLVALGQAVRRVHVRLLTFGANVRERERGQQVPRSLRFRHGFGRALAHSGAAIEGILDGRLGMRPF